VLALVGDDRGFPGDGAVSDRDGTRQFQAFLKDLWEKTHAAVQAGQTLDQTLRSVKLTEDAGYQAIAVPLVLRLDRDFVVKRAWQEATGTVLPSGPAANDAVGQRR
jgi:hypothetical protein